MKRTWLNDERAVIVDGRWRDPIVDTAIEFMRAHKCYPTKVLLTTEVKKAMEQHMDIRRLRKAISSKGIEKALTSIFKLKIIGWNGHRIECYE